MKQVSSAEFRKLYTHESEPVEVTAYGKVIGRYFPFGTEPLSVPGEEAPSAPVEPQAPRFTIRPAHSGRPNLVATTKRVLDPLEMRKRESDRAEEFQARQWQRKP